MAKLQWNARTAFWRILIKKSQHQNSWLKLQLVHSVSEEKKKWNPNCKTQF